MHEPVDGARVGRPRPTSLRVQGHTRPRPVRSPCTTVPRPPAYTLRDPSLYCVDTVDAAGKTVERCSRDGRPEAGWRIPVEIDAPATARAVVVNLTATNAAVGGYLTAEDCKARPDGDRATSNTNYAVGRDAANLAIVPIVDGRICIYRSTAVHSIVDVVGYLSDEVVNEPATWFTPSTPTRLDDTRNSGACSPSGECVTGRLPADRLLAVDLGDVPTAVANLTVVDATSAGFVAAGKCESLAAGAQFSNVNYQASAASANLSVVSGDASGQMCVYSHSDAHVIVDRVGTLDRSVGYGWKLTTPKRVIDTRSTRSRSGDGRRAHPARRRRSGRRGERDGHRAAGPPATQRSAPARH